MAKWYRRTRKAYDLPLFVGLTSQGWGVLDGDGRWRGGTHLGRECCNVEIGIDDSLVRQRIAQDASSDSTSGLCSC